MNLPTRFRIHPVFHVSLLESDVRREDDNETSELFLSDLIDDTEEYEVKEILDRKKYRGEVRYLIKWKG